MLEQAIRDCQYASYRGWNYVRKEGGCEESVPNGESAVLV
jgi:hypothetical protein